MPFAVDLDKNKQQKEQRTLWGKYIYRTEPSERRRETEWVQAASWLAQVISSILLQSNSPSSDKFHSWSHQSKSLAWSS